MALRTNDKAIEERVDKLALRYSKKELAKMGGKESLRKAAKQQLRIEAMQTTGKNRAQGPHKSLTLTFNNGEETHNVCFDISSINTENFAEKSDDVVYVTKSWLKDVIWLLDKGELDGDQLARESEEMLSQEGGNK